MLRVEIIEFNRFLLQNLKRAGIKLDDYKYCDLYRDYIELAKTEPSRKSVFLTLAQRYHITDRQVYNIIKRMEAPV